MTRNETFLNAYITAALWSTSDGEHESLEAFELADETRAEMAKDCLKFQTDNEALLDGLDVAQCGHDFWLTRNGHGSGFWDQGLGEVGDKLTEACENSECDLYLGDDGLVYFM